MELEPRELNGHYPKRMRMLRDIGSKEYWLRGEVHVGCGIQNIIHMECIKGNHVVKWKLLNNRALKAADLVPEVDKHMKNRWG